MEKFEQQPNPEDVQAQTSQTREQFEQERDFRADERTSYRTIWQKMFGREKTTAMDVAMEEALKMDAAIEKELKEGRAETIEEALDNIDKLPEFQLKGTERVEKEEYGRAKTLQVGKAIANNEFYKAVSILHKEQSRKGIDKETAQIMDERTTTLVKEHVANLAQAKDGKNFVNSIYWFASRLESGDLPAEAVRSPEIAGAIREHAISWFRSFYNEPVNFAKELEKFSRLGLLNKEEVAQAPEIQQYAREKAISWFRTFYNEPRTFARIRDGFVQLGIVNAEEINSLPQIQEFAKEKATSWFETFYGEPKTFARLWTDFENLGVLPLEQIRMLPRIREVAKEKLLGRLRALGYRDYKSLLNSYAELGIVDIDEIESMPEVAERRGKSY
ncbi:hypothetical protein A2125_01370 [Candidatus Woesebacteria bacterium GWB1_43_5]|uniref:Uncharacterized protein n=1 Tax=Candidatus Woesebacteria bacterium GWB1_43_5 TaxID=1802474 RepID=A0A1F7WR53_9BACT|nr:MAG: hypothetical protein A2125_01370 [Candidatus Woesebacteria bacterium GWB1_43_5]